MNILICDDIQDEINTLTSLLADFSYPVCAVGFNNGAEALHYIRSGNRIDVCLLDIVMPEMSGIDLARQMRDEGFAGEIVFLSSSREYGPEAFTVEAFNYLLKPPTMEAIRKVLDKIENTLRRADTEGFFANTKSAARFILFRDIAYAEVISRKIYFHLIGGDCVEITATFSEISPQLLCDKRFVQCHFSYIVNMDEISSVTGRMITMRSGVTIPVSRSYSDTKWKYMDWCLEGTKS